MKIIGFDVDGVLYPWHELVHERVSRQYNINKDFFEFWRNPPEKTPIFWENLILDVALYEMSDIDSRILNTLKELSFTYNLVYVTARNPLLNFVTRKWFKHSNIPQLENLHLVHHHKRDKVQELNCDFYVEDRPIHVEELKDITNIILVRRPYNEELWNDFVSIKYIMELPQVLKEIDS